MTEPDMIERVGDGCPESYLTSVIEALRAWAPLVASGYEVPAASEPMLEAARLLETSAIAGVEAALLRRYANAVRTLGPSMSPGALATAMERRADKLDAELPSPRNASDIVEKENER